MKKFSQSWKCFAAARLVELILLFFEILGYVLEKSSLFTLRIHSPKEDREYLLHKPAIRIGRSPAFFIHAITLWKMKWAANSKNTYPGLARVPLPLIHPKLGHFLVQLLVKLPLWSKVEGSYKTIGGSIAGNPLDYCVSRQTLQSLNNIAEMALA